MVISMFFSHFIKGTTFVKGGIEDNSKIFFCISPQKHIL